MHIDLNGLRAAGAEWNILMPVASRTHNGKLLTTDVCVCVCVCVCVAARTLCTYLRANKGWWAGVKCLLYLRLFRDWLTCWLQATRPSFKWSHCFC